MSDEARVQQQVAQLEEKWRLDDGAAEAHDVLGRVGALDSAPAVVRPPLPLELLRPVLDHLASP